MGLLNLFFSPHRHSAAIAKERLKIVLAHERAGRHAPDFLPKLQKELIDVVCRYVAIREDMIRVNLGKSGETSLLEINIEFDGAKPILAGLAGVRTAAPPVKSG
jgi:cell division topological specificity factor